MNLLALSLTLALLPPQADVHNERAMDLDEAGRLDEAADELVAAYTAMPDPRADRDGREQVLGSLRGVLLEQHQRTGAAAPLCRLRDLLRDHLAALEASHADTPERIEITGNRERLVAVEAQLAGQPPGACEPPGPAPAPVAAAPAPAPRATAAPLAPRPSPAADGPTPKQLRIVGGISLGLGAVLLGVMTYGIVDNQRHGARARDIDAKVGDRPITPDELAALQEHRYQAQSSQILALGTGISSGIFSVIAVAILARKTNKKTKTSKGNSSRNGVLMAPWRVPAGVGVTLRLPLP